MEWLRKDRDYQIAAAHFYSLDFDQARTRFAAIALDPASPWQETADYLVGRTWVRQASLTENEDQRDQVYRQAELYLQALQVRSNKFARATQRLLGLVKYRLHPEERVAELGRILAYQSGNDNLGQDLIDYVWLVDDLRPVPWQRLKNGRIRPGNRKSSKPNQMPSMNAGKKSVPASCLKFRFFRKQRKASRTIRK